MKYWVILLAIWVTPVFSLDLIQNTASRHYLSLDGQWNAIVDAFDVGDKRQFFKNEIKQKPSQLLEYDFTAAGKLQVPGDWNTQDKELFRYEGSIWYQRNFNIKKDKSKHYVIHFGAVNYLAKVYVNGALVGEHEGGFTPFQFDVSKNLNNGKNSIVVKVNNRREANNIPAMNTDWWNYGGITRSIKLLELEETYIQDYKIDYVHGIKSGIHATIKTVGNTRSGDQIKLYIPELGINKNLRVDAKGFAQIEFSATPTLWEPSSPKLYDVKIEFGNEIISDRIGFRYIEVKGSEILLNGKSIFLRGVALHEENPRGAGRAWSETDDKTLLGWAKELGCNYVRLAHYPHNEKMLRLADEMGLLVWAEIPVYWDILFDSEVVYQKAEAQYTEMITRDKNRASIILWSVANETPKNETRTKFLSRLVDKVHELDSGRLVTAAINTQSTTKFGRKMDDPFAEKLDVIGINTYCGWYDDKPKECANYRWESDYNKPIIVSEFGAGALQGYHGSKDEIFTEEFQVDVFQNNLLMLDNMNSLRGVSPWVLKDFLSPRRPLANIQDYWNRKGLRSERGEEKEVWNVMKAWYEKKARETE